MRSNIIMASIFSMAFEMLTSSIIEKVTIQLLKIIET
ncbi:hypothetical protein BMETH_932_1 [methanotrophic bacterial endosymbiont of Bathymodiolus sp.]|nr:hypothetical protein BMETH_932_1 [methanotrophic bacterial endosymbiont of Bathymodiolus sp.]